MLSDDPQIICRYGAALPASPSRVRCRMRAGERGSAVVRAARRAYRHDERRSWG